MLREWIRSAPPEFRRRTIGMRQRTTREIISTGDFERKAAAPFPPRADQSCVQHRLHLNANTLAICCNDFVWRHDNAGSLRNAWPYGRIFPAVTAILAINAAAQTSSIRFDDQCPRPTRTHLKWLLNQSAGDFRKTCARQSRLGATSVPLGGGSYAKIF
jgi:hypothetical protein